MGNFESGNIRRDKDPYRSTNTFEERYSEEDDKTSKTILFQGDSITDGNWGATTILIIFMDMATYILLPLSWAMN